MNEIDDPKWVVGLLGVLVSPLGGVSEEWSISHIVRLLPVPVSRVPLEVGDEVGSENPVEEGFRTWEGEVLCQFEGRAVAVLSKHPDRFVSFQGYGDGVGAGGSDAACVGDSPEF